MATRTSNATGDWSAGSTWIGGVAPGDGDDAVIADGHVVTVDTNITVGPGGGAGAVAITVNQSNGSQKLVIGANNTLTVKGNIQLRGRVNTVSERIRLQLEEGSEIAMHTTGGDRQIICAAGSSELTTILFNGVAGNRCTISKIGSNDWGFVQGGTLSMNLFGAYARIIGATQEPCLQWPDALGQGGGGYSGVNLDHVEFDACGTVDMDGGGPSANIPFILTNSTVINSTAPTYCFKYQRSVAAGINATLTGNVLGTACYITMGGVTIEDNIFCEVVATAGTAKAASNRRNFYITDASSGGFALTSNTSDQIDNIFWYRNAAANNPHWGVWDGLFSQVLDGVIFFLEADNAQGDSWSGPPSTPGSPVKLTIRNTIRAPSRLGTDGTPGPFFTNTAATANATVAIEHNTAYVADGGSGAYLGEHTGGDYPGQCTSFKSNIHVGRGASLPSGFVIDADPVNSTQDTDWVAAADADYNAYADVNAGSRGKGYNFTGTGSPGANDLNEDPAFVDPTRCPLTWAQSIDGGVADNDDVIALLLTKNDDAGVDPDVADAVRSLLDYTRAGFLPTNTALQGAAHDGTDIGAVPFEAPTPPDVVCSSNFTGTDHTSLSGATLDNALGGTETDTWSLPLGGAWEILNNEAHCTTNGGGGDSLLLVGSTADVDQQHVSVTITRTFNPGDVGPVLRYNSGSGKFYLVFVSSASSPIDLYYWNGSGFSLLGTGSMTPGTNVVVRVEADGTTLKVYLDGILDLVITDSNIPTGRPGIYGRAGSGGATVDNFRYEIAGTPPPPSGAAAAVQYYARHLQGV